jgi:hypothetical protein
MKSFHKSKARIVLNQDGGSMRLLNAAVFCMSCMELSACVPVSWHYARIDAPNAVYYQNMCHAEFGPPALAFYPFHGIFISLDLIDSVRLGIHVPGGYTVQLNDTSIRIKGQGKGEAFDAVYRIKAFRQESLGNGEPRSFLALPDPFTQPNNFGPLTGGAQDDQSIFYLYLGIQNVDSVRVALPPPETLSEGSIELPSLSINGQRFESQTLSFVRKHYFDFVTANC